MKKIKRFVINNNLVVLSAEIQKKVLGGASVDTTCAEWNRSQCGGDCIQNASYSGICTWVDGTGCRCSGYYSWPG